MMSNAGNSRIPKPLIVCLWLLQLAALMHFYVFKWDYAYVIIPLWVGNALFIMRIRYWWIPLSTLLIYFIHVSLHIPRIDNHAQLEWLCILSGACIYACSYQQRELWYHRFSFFIISITVAVYFYAGFHKLNRDFFDSTVSCVNFVNRSFGYVFNVDEEFLYASSRIWQVLTLFVELVAPWGLFFSPTRKWAALILLTFHFYIAPAGLSNFGSFAVLLLVCCCFDTSVLMSAHFHKRVYTYITIAFLSVTLIYLLQKWNVSIIYRLFAQGLVFNIALVTMMYEIWRSRNFIRVWNTPSTVWACFLFLMISVWSLKTYVGWGNTGNLTMFSNLVTEKNRSNHLLIQTSFTKVNNLEEDVVHILDLDTAYTRLYSYLRLQGMLIPKTELSYRLKASPSFANRPLQSVLIYKSDTLRISDLHQSEFSEYKWWYKYVPFRQIQPDGKNRCRW